MRSAAFRRIALAILSLGAAAAASAAMPAIEARFYNTDYVSMVDVCASLGLRFGLSADGSVMTLVGGAHRAVLSGRHSEEREMDLDGVRVYLGDPAVARGGHFYVSRLDYLHRLLPLLRPDLIRTSLRRPRVIMLDPGHGGSDPGAQNRRYGLREKDLTLDVALRLRKLLLAEGWTVLMTRTRDTQLSTNKVADLELRAVLAAEQHADIYLSIHFDAAASSSVHGSEIFSYIPVGQRSTESWGTGRNDRHNEAQAGNRNDDWNMVLAHSLFRVMPRDMATFDHGERIRDLSVLRNAPCPAVLVEPAYLSNDSEAKRLLDPAFRERIAATLAAGLRNYSALLGTFQPAVPTFRAAPPAVLSRPRPPQK